MHAFLQMMLGLQGIYLVRTKLDEAMTNASYDGHKMEEVIPRIYKSCNAEMIPIIKTLLCRDFFFSRIIWWVNGPTDNTMASRF
jgi:hypothetical protein